MHPRFVRFRRFFTKNKVYPIIICTTLSFFSEGDRNFRTEKSITLFYIYSVFLLLLREIKSTSERPGRVKKLRNRRNSRPIVIHQLYTRLTPPSRTTTIQLHGFPLRGVAKHRMTSILFHVLPPIHREILVARRCSHALAGAKQGDGKSFSLVRREAKVYIYIFPVLAPIYSLSFALISPSRLVAFFLLLLLLGFYLRALSLHFKSLHPRSISSSLSARFFLVIRRCSGEAKRFAKERARLVEETTTSEIVGRVGLRERREFATR